MRAPETKNRWALTSAFFMVSWVLLLAFGPPRTLGDPGVLWHTMAGARMLATGHVLRDDPFSATMGGKPWVAMQWLSECLMAIVHRMAGFDGLSLAASTIVASIFALLAGRLLRAGCNAFVVALLLAVAACASASHLVVRPHLASLGLFTWMVASLADFEAGRVGTRRILSMVPACILWANLHGGVLGGIATLLFTVCGWFLARTVGFASPLRNRGRAMAALSVSVFAVLGTLLNPYGPRLWSAWFGIVRSQSLPKILAEHQPMTASAPEAAAVAALGAAYLFVLTGARPAVRITSIVVWAWFALAWTKIMYAPYFALSALVALAELLPACAWFKRLPTRSIFALHPIPTGSGRRALALPAALVAFAAALEVGHVRVPVLGTGWARLDVSIAPLGLRGPLQSVEARFPVGTGILNDLDLGGFVIYFAPRLRVFIDDRYELYGDAFMLDYMRAGERPDAGDRYADRYRLRLALLQAGSELDRSVSQGARWRVIARADDIVLYERVDAAGQAVSE
jgi:hypothetical protein